MTIKSTMLGLWLAVLSINLTLSSLQATAAVIEEIVVTAQKREQNLSDVGIPSRLFRATS
jgi:outer membrane cobalamin receptor